MCGFRLYGSSSEAGLFLNLTGKRMRVNDDTCSCVAISSEIRKKKLDNGIGANVRYKNSIRDTYYMK